MVEDFPTFHARPTREQPLAGITALLVEDSRCASEAMRLLALKSGARLRRADSLAAAHRHLSVYRPMLVIVDMGLPDGSGAELIGTLARAEPRVPVLLGTSGDPGGVGPDQPAHHRGIVRHQHFPVFHAFFHAPCPRNKWRALLKLTLGCQQTPSRHCKPPEKILKMRSPLKIRN